MGLYCNAELIWGILVAAYDEEEGDPTQFWNDEDDDWREMAGKIEVQGYGHYEDPNNTLGILTTDRVKSFSADCWNPVALTDDLSVSDVTIALSNDEALASNLSGVDFATARWHLVASFG